MLILVVCDGIGFLVCDCVFSKLFDRFFLFVVGVLDEVFGLVGIGGFCGWLDGIWVLYCRILSMVINCMGI